LRDGGEGAVVDAGDVGRGLAREGRESARGLAASRDGEEREEGDGSSDLHVVLPLVRAARHEDLAVRPL
jgi:hypothetical protein